MTSSERAIVAAIFLTGLLLRLLATDRLAVEHFDEGVYTSTLWYDYQTGEPWPARHLYAPPLLSWLMRMADMVPGLHARAAFVPGILTGALTTLVLWFMVREWFGKSAGLFAACLVAFSDFHIMSSRMALTDVPVLFLICLSVSCGTRGIARQSLRSMVWAGLTCGLAWWTKYTGWLPLAIVGSGSSLWWIWRGRRELSLIRLLSLQLAMLSVSVIVWLPWWWRLQDLGGYAAVAANHRGYLGTAATWSERLATQLTCQFLLDGLCGAVSVGVGMLAASTYRWMQSRTRGPDPAVTGAPLVAFPPPRLLARFVLAATALTIIASTIWTPLLLTCLALAGLSGMALWPILYRSFVRRQSGDCSPTGPHSLPLGPGDLACAPTIDPTLGLCTVTAWLTGMLLTTPLYHPYPRLMLPLLTAIWIAASGGAGWWIESSLSVARRPAAAGPPRTRLQSLATRLVSLLLLFATASSILMNQDFLHSLIYSDRTSLQQAAAEIAAICSRDALGHDLPPVPAPLLNQTIRPRDADESQVQAARTADTSAEQRNGDSSEPAVTTEADPTDPGRVRMVLYAYGEPALLYHLSQLGIVVRPVSHLNLRNPDGDRNATPAYLVIGPYAKRTPGFWDDWLERHHDFRFLRNATFRPSELVLLDLFPPAWLKSHPEAAEQTLEVYRIR